MYWPARKRGIQGESVKRAFLLGSRFQPCRSVHEAKVRALIEFDGTECLNRQSVVGKPGVCRYGIRIVILAKQADFQGSSPESYLPEMADMWRLNDRKKSITLMVLPLDIDLAYIFGCLSARMLESISGIFRFLSLIAGHANGDLPFQHIR